MYNAVLFQWDEIKREANRKKHGVDFEDAVLVFDDPDYVLLDDRIDEWTGEQRFLAIGSAKTRSGQRAILLVAHVYREETNDEEVTRIISAREANDRERRLYFQQITE